MYLKIKTKSDLVHSFSFEFSFYSFKKNLKYTKTVLNMTDTMLSGFLDISRMSLSRYQNEVVVPNDETLEKIYNKIYDSGIYLNRIKEEMYASNVKENHTLLFHGSKSYLKGNPSIEYSDCKKDFGKGFYFGESFNQAASFVFGYEHSSVYIFDFDKNNVNIKEFNVSKEWMILIAYFRGKLDNYKNSNYLKCLLGKMKNIDVIVAPIADNTMYTILDDFIQGKITDLQCLNALSANRLGRQYVFLNDSVINNNLKLLERCYYSSLERKDYMNYRLKENEIGKNKVILALREYAGKGNYIEDILK